MGNVRLGVIGAGGFGAFVAEAVSGLAGLEIAAVCDADAGRARTFAAARGLDESPGVADLLADDRLDGVVIATPPAFHADLAVAALESGRHVFCEKPLAVSVADARRVRDAQEASGRVLVVDHVIRYNPLVRAVADWLAAGVVGPAQRFDFENDAGDSGLPPDHWFWRPEVSGGILLEHGVHFFDVAAMLLGSPAVSIQAMGHRRPDGRVDTVVATATHAGGALATHAHGFAHANPAERQLLRVDYGLAEVRLEGWIPLSLALVAWVDDEQLGVLASCAADAGVWLAVPGFRPGARCDATLTVERDAAAGPLRTRDAWYVAPHRARLSARLGAPADKQAVYLECVRAALTDFRGAITRGTRPQAGVREGAAAVASAVAGTLALAGGGTVPVESL